MIIGMTAVWLTTCTGGYVEMIFWDRPGCKGNQVTVDNELKCYSYGPPMSYIASIETVGVDADFYPPAACSA